MLGLDGDPTPGDYSAAAELVGDLRGTGDHAYQARRGVAALLQDPALVSWLGKSGEAFKGACAPFPDQLASMYKSFHDAADAVERFRAVLITAQSDADSALANGRSALESVGLTSDSARSLAGISDDTAYLHQALLLLESTQPPPMPGPVSPAPTGGATAPGPASPSGPSTSPPQPSKGPGPWAIGAGPATPEVQKAFDQIQAARTAVVRARDAWSDAHRKAISSIRDATDAAVSAMRWADGKTGSGQGGTFEQRFAALGGDLADLVLPASAALDLEESALPAADASAADVMAWWTGLSPDQQAEWETDHPDQIGSLDGIPAEVRDKVNRKLLDTQIAQLQENGSDPVLLDTLKRLRDSLNMTGPVWRTDSHKQKGPNPDYYSAPMPPLLLLHFDTTGNGHLIMAAGNPDTASNVVTYVPGLGTTLSEHMIDNDIPHTENLYLQALQDHPDASVSSVFWLGYDAPVIPGLSPGSHSDIGHALDVAGTANAQDGAPDLTRFLNGLHATSTAPGPVHYTALGHSYGSLVVGTAAASPGGIPVDDIILVGSPGVGSDHASDLNVPAGHVWAGAAANDPVPTLRDAVQAESNNFVFVDPGPSVDHFIQNLTGGSTYGGWFGQNPTASQFGANVFHVAPGDDGNLGMDAHGEYFDPRVRGLDQQSDGSSLTNMANIVVGDYGKVTPS